MPIRWLDAAICRSNSGSNIGTLFHGGHMRPIRLAVLVASTLPAVLFLTSCAVLAQAKAQVGF
jgi:hypothetical protein